MTHSEFAKLHYEDKCRLIKQKASRVGYRQDNKLNYYLFQLESFYLEIITRAGSEEIELINYFGWNELPEGYITHIDVNKIINYSRQ
jgi:hypothetical protein